MYVWHVRMYTLHPRFPHVRMYVMYACMHACMHVCMYVCMYVHSPSSLGLWLALGLYHHVCMYVWYVRMYSLHPRLPACTYVCDVCMYACMYARMYVCMYTLLAR